jgi:hypothetical protein
MELKAKFHLIHKRLMEALETERKEKGFMTKEE